VAEWAVRELRIPDSVDDDDAVDFIANIDIINLVQSEASGHSEFDFTAAEMLPMWRSSASPRTLFGVHVDGELVGRAMYARLASDTATCWVSIGVLPGFRGRGIGTALAERLEQAARSEGRSKLISYVLSKVAQGGERIDAPTGYGSVPAGNTEVRFLLGKGYRLEQVGRRSRMPLPASVTVTPPDDYRLHFWVDRTPERWLEQMANLHTRMSTDAPSAGLEAPEDVWTVERVREEDDAAASDPRPYLVAVVEHIPTGELAGYTTLAVPVEAHRPVAQFDTLVLREHRGNRLGMLLKLANIDHLQRLHPGYPSIVTSNAEENRFMLDVNEAVGFVPIGYDGAWRKDL